MKFDGHNPNRQEPNRLILFMHGARTYIPNKRPFFKKICQELRADVIAFQYRGFGQSDGKEPTQDGIKLDADAIIRFFKEKAKDG